jgi:hypothetical protein
VGVLHAAADLAEDVVGLGHRQRPARESPAEILAFQVLHEQVQEAARRVVAAREHAHDGGVVERGQGVDLADEALARGEAVAGVHDLAGGAHPLGQDAAGEEDRAHAARAERLDDDPVPDAVAWVEHAWRS